MLSDNQGILLSLAVSPGSLLLKAIPGANDFILKTADSVCGSVVIENGSFSNPGIMPCRNNVGLAFSGVVTAGLAWLAYKLLTKGKG